MRGFREEGGKWLVLVSTDCPTVTHACKRVTRACMYVHVCARVTPVCTVARHDAGVLRAGDAGVTRTVSSRGCTPAPECGKMIPVTSYQRGTTMNTAMTLSIEELEV